MATNPLESIPPLVSSIFGAGTGVPTYEELKRRRAAAVAAAAQRSPYARNLGEGIQALGEGVGQRLERNRLDDAERALEEKNKQAVWEVQNPGVPYPGAAAGLPAAAPAVPTGATAAAAPAPDYRARIAALVTPGGGAGVPPPNPTAAAPTIAMSEPLLRGSDEEEALWNRRAGGIGGIETGGRRDPYRTLGAVTKTGDRAHGRYGIMGRNIPEWTQAAIGAPLTPEQFLASEAAQDDVFRHRFGGYVDKYGEEGAAKAWYGGERGMKNPNATDMHGRLTVGGYGADYINRLGGAPEIPRGAPTAALATGVTSDAPDVGAPPVIPGSAEANPPTFAEVRPAPPADPIRVAGPATAAAPAAASYEMPEPKRATPPRPLPMSDRETRLRRSLPLIHPESPQYRATQQIIGEFDYQRTEHDKREIERSKSEDALYNTLYPKWQEFQATKNKRRLDEEKLEQEVEVGKRPHTQIVDERLMQWDKTKKSWEDVTPDPKGVKEGDAPVIKLNAEQSKDLGFHSKAALAMEQYSRVPNADKVLADGLRDELAGKLPFVGNAALTKRYRIVRNAAEAFIQAHLRDISGAAIGAKEMMTTYANLVPIYGDDPITQKNKAAQRNEVVQGLYLGLGKARPLADYATKKRVEADTAEQAKIAKEMAGVGVPEVGKIYTDKDKNGKVIGRRFWTGSRWEDD